MYSAPGQIIKQQKRTKVFLKDYLYVMKIQYYSGLQNIEKDSYFAAYATPHYVDSISQAGFTNAFGVGGSWQPINSNWIPSISATKTNITTCFRIAF